MSCFYDSDLNVFNLVRGERVVKQIPGTSHTLVCSDRAIRRIEGFLAEAYRSYNPKRKESPAA
jgi:hypothetical protein